MPLAESRAEKAPALSSPAQALPKTRSGKLMRRVVKAVTLDRDPGDVSTIEDEGSVEEARHAWEEMKQDMQI
jgi:acetyl-CoA synthetase